MDLGHELYVVLYDAQLIMETVQREIENTHHRAINICLLQFNLQVSYGQKNKSDLCKGEVVGKWEGEIKEVYEIVCPSSSNIMCLCHGVFNTRLRIRHKSLTENIIMRDAAFLA